MKRWVAAGLMVGVMFGTATMPATAKDTKPKEVKLYPDRAGAKKKDRERKIGAGVELSGYTTTVTAAKWSATAGPYEKDGYVIVDATELDRDTKSQSYSLSDWHLQTPAGEVLDTTFTTMDGVKSSGSLVHGGTVKLRWVFKVGPLASAKGRYYVLWKPDLFNDDRGVWAVDVK